MKKKVTLWLSRDEDGEYQLWSRKPTLKCGSYADKEGLYWPFLCTVDEDYITATNLFLKKGGLARITVERMY